MIDTDAPLTSVQQERSLTLLGYPRRRGDVQPSKDAPAAILRRQARLVKPLQHLDTFQRCALRSLTAETYPVTPEEVAAWRAGHPERARLSGSTAAALCWLRREFGR